LYVPWKRYFIFRSDKAWAMLIPANAMSPEQPLALCHWHCRCCSMQNHVTNGNAKYTAARCSWYKYFGTDAMKRSLMDVRHDDAGQDVFGFGEKGHG
jgi:hypothetical protein